jgi:choline dehydrogenase
LWTCQAEVPKTTPENAAKFGVPAAGWSLFSGIGHPKSRGYVELTGANPLDPVRIVANTLTHPDDWRAARACIEMSREVGNALALRPFVKREVMPGNLKGAELDEFIRNAAASFWHESGTAKMGNDDMSVVDAKLKVRGIEGLRVADASVLPRLTTGNTMAPCVVIGERASDLLRETHAIRG